MFGNDDEDEEDLGQNKALGSGGTTGNVNGFLKLVMNLMNAYNLGDDQEVDCIWQVYCHQLNK